MTAPDIAPEIHDAGHGLAAAHSSAHFREYQKQLYEECLAAGWDLTQQNSFAEECAHLHEEISEAFRVFRARKTFETWVDENGRPQGIPVELADVLIGLFYNAELHGFDLWEAVEQKRAYNRTRNYIAEARQLHAPNALISHAPIS